MKLTSITSPRDNTVTVSSPGDHAIFFHNISINLDIEIAHPDARVFLYGLYIGSGKSTYTLTTHQHHTVPGGYSELLVKGVFDDQSSLNYSGYIKIEKHCNGSHAYQKNQTLLLSSKAHVTSEPNLEILSPDVFCTHGSTTGQINTEHLYYMQAKGVSAAAARKLFVDGFVNDLVHKIQDKVPTFQFHHH